MLTDNQRITPNIGLERFKGTCWKHIDGKVLVRLMNYNPNTDEWDIEFLRTDRMHYDQDKFLTNNAFDERRVGLEDFLPITNREFIDQLHWFEYHLKKRVRHNLSI